VIEFATPAPPRSSALIGIGFGIRLSDIEERFTCRVCGKRGADVRPDFNWERQPVEIM
jgi:hypothetical protein